MRQKPTSGMVAVLFTDIVGSTELMSRLGDGGFDDLRRSHFATLREAIGRLGGEEVKNTGDGVMATFGSVVNAIACAVTMQQATDRQAHTAGLPLAIRVGLSLGEVTFEDNDVFGTPVVEAARLVGAAGAGQILTTDIAKALAVGRAGVEFVDLGPLDLKGLAYPVVVCEVTWTPLAVPSLPLPSLLTDIGIFVGRDPELERLERLWGEAAAGSLRVALLAGEPGVGKTRLAAEIAGRAHGGGGTVLAGRCDEDLGVPYQPFVEVIRSFVEQTSPGELAEGLGRYGGELARLVPEVSKRAPGLPSPLRSDPETERYRLFDAVTNWLVAASADQPVLLILDDLQWAAKPTLLLFRHVIRSPQLKQILILGTYRDTELGHGHPLVEVLADLRRQAGVERIALTGLDSAGVAALMEQVAGQALGEGDLPLARAICEETEGNPFFVREVLRHLVETGAVDRREGRWVTHLPVEDLGIPEGVRDVVGRRLSRLSEGANRVLRVASVIGAECELRVLRRATEGFDDESLLSALEEATEARLVMEASDRTGLYRFAHALVRGALYDALSAGRRVMLHHRVAGAIETEHAERLDDYLPALAHHYAQAWTPGSDAVRAVDYATRAGDRAGAQLAHDDAVAYYRQALELLRAADGAADEAHRLALLMVLGQAQRCAGDPAHRETLLLAGRLAHELGDPERAALAALANQRGLFSRFGAVDSERVEALRAALEAVGPSDTPVRARLLASLASELYWADDTRRHELGRAALDIARRLSEPVTLAEVIVAVWLATWDPAAATGRAQLAEELTQIATRLNDPILEFHAGVALFLTTSQLADMERANAGLGLCRRVAEQLGQPVLRWLTAVLEANRATAVGQLDEAEQLAENARRLGESSGQPDSAIYHHGALATIRGFQGRFQEAPAITEDSPLAAFRAGSAWIYAELGCGEQARAIVDDMRADDFAGIPRQHQWLVVLAFLSRAATLLDHAEAAAEIYPLLLPNRSEVVVAIAAWVGPVAHDLGLLATTLRRYRDAEAHFAQATEIEDRIGARAMAAHTQLEWARMLMARRQSGDAERAAKLLGEALATARELRLEKVERLSVAVLEQLR